jgi:multicomponent K+:H+ antiporter subunit G
MDMVIEYFIAAFLVMSGIFGFVGSYGLIKLRTTMQRLHAPTKATTLGVGGVLIASMLHFAFFEDTLSFHELLITLFLFITAPVTANFIAKTYLTCRVPASELPETESDYGWAIYEDPPKQE